MKGMKGSTKGGVRERGGEGMIWRRRK